MFVRMLKLPEAVRRRYDLGSLRWVTHTGAPCAPETKRALMDWWGPVVYETYGGTEVGTATLSTPQDWLEFPGSVGRLTPGARMALYAETAPALGIAAIEALAAQLPIHGITHFVVASCTGFVAPGVDQIIARQIGLSPSVERLLIGFMGCYAAVAALRTARHIVRSEPAARVLVLCVELS
eukprot:gene16697-21311_t